MLLTLPSFPQILWYGFPEDPEMDQRRVELLSVAWFLYTGQPVFSRGVDSPVVSQGPVRVAVVLAPGAVLPPEGEEELGVMRESHCVTAVYPVGDCFRIFSNSGKAGVSSSRFVWPFLLLVETPWFLSFVREVAGSYRLGASIYADFFGPRGMNDPRFRSGESLLAGEEFQKALSWCFLLFGQMGVPRAPEGQVWAAIRNIFDHPEGYFFS